jgi:pimeloyl-ACP methyl ester carboxylesterase
MLSARLDSALAGFAARGHALPEGASTRYVDTEAGRVRVFDSGGAKPPVVFVPDGPNVVEHYKQLFPLLTPYLRVVCFDMPGFGFSLPSASYTHSLDQGAATVLAVLDALEIERATLAFSCANGFYALRTALLAPQRIVSLVLSQTPSMAAMQRWTTRIVPSLFKVPVIGQLVMWLTRRRAAHGWYDIALPRNTDRAPFRSTAQQALRCGACFSLASIAQGLGRETDAAIAGVTTPCVLVWGPRDHSHRHTPAASLRDCVPHAQVAPFEDCGHFPDLEQPARYARLLIEHLGAAKPGGLASDDERPPVSQTASPVAVSA